jgi:lysophospholipase L1-like esterase
MNDPNMVKSPYNINSNGALWDESNYAGAYWALTFTTTGTSALNILYDPSPNTAGSLSASNYPTIGVSLNPANSGGKYVYTQITSTGNSIAVSASLAPGTYELRWYVKSIRGGTDGGRWNPSCRKVRFLGVQADASAVTVSMTKRSNKAIAFGDSITQGVGTLGVSSASNDDAFAGWTKAWFDGMDAEGGNIGLSGQQWGGTITTIPAFYKASNSPPDTYTYHEAGISRLSGGVLADGPPDYCAVLMGTNDGTSNIASNVQSTISGLRTICGANCYIFIIYPFGGYERSGTTGIPAGFNAYTAANPSDKRVFLIDAGNNIAPISGLNNSTSGAENQYSYDGLHPKSVISMAYGGRIAQLCRAAIASAASTAGVGRSIHPGGKL